jgi:FlaA1/EpsC-like NDP-sugar epimerase
MMNMKYAGKTILITGAGGCIGSAIAKCLIGFDPRLLVLLDRSEHSLYQIEQELNSIPNCPRYTPILGDVCDESLLADIFETCRPDIVFHSAAFKHVPLLEANPFEAVRNNIFGTLSLAKAAVDHEIAKMVVISTDKAANPQSILGVTKRIAELVSLRCSGVRNQISVIRLGNVLGSPGSVVPLFLKQISQGGPVTVTHPEVSRCFLTLNDAVELILAAGSLEGYREIFVPKLGDPIKIVDLARHLIREAGLVPEKDMPIVFTGHRPGDKITEEFASTSESLRATCDSRFWRIEGSDIKDNFEVLISALGDSLSSRNLPGLVEILCRLVPEYQPSELLRGALDRSLF